METSLLLRILDVSRRMAEMRAFAPLLNYVVQQAIELVGAERGYLVLPQPDGSLDFRVTLDQQGRVVPHAEDQISRSILKQVVDSGEPLIVRDAVADPQFSSAQSVMALNLRSVMCVPLISYGRAIGAIYVENRSVRNRFKEDDLPPLVLFGHQAAAAIENAALNDDLEARVVAVLKNCERLISTWNESWREATEANRVRTVLLSKITHDIRSPLSLADNTLEAMEIGLIGPLTATQREWLDRARAAMARALRLTRDIGQLMNIEWAACSLPLKRSIWPSSCKTPTTWRVACAGPTAWNFGLRSNRTCPRSKSIPAALSRSSSICSQTRLSSPLVAVSRCTPVMAPQAL